LLISFHFVLYFASDEHEDKAEAERARTRQQENYLEARQLPRGLGIHDCNLLRVYHRVTWVLVSSMLV